MSNREVFRRSALTMVPHWGLAAGLALTVLWAANHFDLRPAWDGLLLAALPLAWATARTVQWAAGTWTATADGTLIVQAGVLFRSREEIPLRATLRAHVQPCLPSRWLDVGHLAWDVGAGPRGQRRSLRWMWLGGPTRLAEILHGRGQVALGRPSRWQRWISRARQAEEGRGGSRQSLPASGQEYQQFLAFCRRLLDSQGTSSWPPDGVPVTAIPRWMAVLRQARIVMDASGNPGWRLAARIRSLDDVQRRIGEEELQRATRESV